MAKHIPLPVESLSEDTQALYDVLNNEPDFSVVLISVAYIDACLAALLEKLFAQSSVSSKLLDPRSGALGSFSARSDACYVLGLVSKSIYQDLLVLAEIRNQFAHYHLLLDFAKPEIAESCLKLTYIATLKRWDMNTDESMFKADQIQDPRFRFVTSTVIIKQQLLLTVLGSSIAAHVTPVA